jgi:hypothetical protein
MAISAAHSAAARQNGKMSHGPASAAGKSKSSQNARKHNLLGSTALLSSEDQAQFDQIAASFLAEYKPETPTENHYVREMIDAEFRLLRVRAHLVSLQEARMRQISQNPNMDDAAEAFRQLAQEGPSLSLLQRYENQFRRQFDKSLQMLLDFRLRANTDRDRVMKVQEASKQTNPPKPNPVSFPKEPTVAAAPSSPARRKTVGHLFTRYFGAWGR